MTSVERASSHSSETKSRRCPSSSQSVKTASNWSTMTAGLPSAAAAASSARCALRSSSGEAVGSNTVTGPAMPGAACASATSLGSTPARSSDDLPAPDGPTSISGTGEDSAAIVTSSSVTSSRPKNQRASSGSNLASPRYGLLVLLPGGRRARVSAISHCAIRPASFSPQTSRIRSSCWRSVGRWRPEK